MSGCGQLSRQRSAHTAELGEGGEGGAGDVGVLAALELVEELDGAGVGEAGEDADGVEGGARFVVVVGGGAREDGEAGAGHAHAGRDGGGVDGDAVESRRYAATPEEGAEDLVTRLMADVVHALAQRPDLTVCIVQDGASELWGLLWTALREHGIKKWREVIDRYHLNEHLSAALALVERDPSKRQRVSAQWQHELDTKQTAIDAIESALCRQSGRVARSKRSEFEGHLSYFCCNAPRLRYARMKREGLPIGSGVTEGTCNLTLRALQLSERMPRFWRHFKTRFHASVRVAL